jgi:polyhydroxyalkanoate synthesis repressor PhaR
MTVREAAELSARKERQIKELTGADTLTPAGRNGKLHDVDAPRYIAHTFHDNRRLADWCGTTPASLRDRPRLRPVRSVLPEAEERMSDVEQEAKAIPQPPQDDGSAGAKIIKRYTNRKLYDTVESRYVTLDEIAEMVKGGLEVKIVDNRTKEDLTSITLAQIIFEEEKRDGQMPLGLLKRLIQGGGNAVQDFISERVTSRVGALREEAGKLFKREEPPRVAAPAVREMFTTSQRAFEEWQRRIDDRVRSAVEAVTGLTHLQPELQRLHERLDALDRKIALLEGLEAHEPRAASPSPTDARPAERPMPAAAVGSHKTH